MVSGVLVPDPLNHDVPIVDARGRPTPQFIQQWLKSRRVALAVDETVVALEELYEMFDNYYTKAEADATFETELELLVTKRDGSTIETCTETYPVYQRDGDRVDIMLQGAGCNQFAVTKRDASVVLVTMT